MSWNYKRDAVISEKKRIIEYHTYTGTTLSNRKCYKFIQALLRGDSHRWDNDYVLENLTWLRVYRYTHSFTNLDHQDIAMAIDRFTRRARIRV